MNGALSGPRILITGAAKGIGLARVERFISDHVTGTAIAVDGGRTFH